MTVRALRSIIVCVLALVPVRAGAQGSYTNMLPNSSFESGRAEPAYWSGFGFAPRNWGFEGHEGERSISITGNGINSGWWYAARWAQVQPSTLYRMSYWARCGSAPDGGSVLSGLNLVNRCARVGREWEREEYYFRAPEYLPDVQLRLGQQRINGTVYFDDVALQPAAALHRSRGARALSLGAGESIMDGRYTAVHEMGGMATNDCGFLHHFSGKFDTDRWVLDRLDEVVYRHMVTRLGMGELDQVMRAGPATASQTGVGRGRVTERRPVEITQHDPRCLQAFQQKEITIELVVDRCDGGRMHVDVSRDGRLWLRVVDMKEPGVAKIAVPRHMFPVRDLWVRLKSEHAARIEVSGYRYSSLLGKPGMRTAAVGASHYLAVLYSSPDLAIELTDVGDLIPGGRSEVNAIIENSGSRRKLRAEATITKGKTVVSESKESLLVGPGSKRRVYLPYTVSATGEHKLRLVVSDRSSGRLLSLLEGRFVVPALWEAAGGEVLSSDPALAIWWCEPERKVGEIRPVPTRKGSAVRISAAGGECEPAQLVLKPSDWLRECRLTVSDLTAESGDRMPASEVEIRRVGYVLVTERTDEVGDLGKWPDPLVELREPVDLRPGRNHPFWVTVRVPRGTPVGDYRGEIVIQAQGIVNTVPLVVHVWGFDLPEETHVRSGFGLSPEFIKRYHNLETEEELQQVLECYLESFAAHRVSPLWAACQLDVEWEKTREGEVEPVIDFAEFDEEAQRVLDELGFEALVLRPAGLGEDSDGSRQVREIAGAKRGTPAYEAALERYARAIQDHLAEHGWLGKVYVEWFDEPGEEEVRRGQRDMKLICEAGPKLTYLLAARPTPRLYGAVDLWCLPIHELDPESTRARQRAGDEVWWSLSRETRAPYLAHFVDHHGTEMRLWLWQTWECGVDGIASRETNYWDSEAAYPRSKVQNPWEDPMSWMSRSDIAEGARMARGNGDGRLLYPPNRHAPYESRKFLEGPVPSIRWELLRDGIEDYEYFWLLREAVEKLKRSGADPSTYREAEKLLGVPAEVCTDLTHFTTTPEPIHQHRAKVARAIERLSAK